MRINVSRGARALVALACVTLAVLLGILGWRGLSFANELTQGVHYGVVSTIEDPTVSISMPSTARIKLLRAEAAGDAALVQAGSGASSEQGDVSLDSALETAYYLGYSSAQGTVANESAGATAAEVNDHTVRITLTQGSFDTTGVTSAFGAGAASVDLAPGGAATATFNQTPLASLNTAQEDTFNQGVHTELSRLQSVLGAAYPSTSSALDEVGYELAFVNFPAATTVTIVGETGEVEACYTPGQEVFCKLENAPQSAACVVAWYSTDARGNRLEQVGEGWSLTLTQAYEGLTAVVTDVSGLYLGEATPAKPALVKTPAPYAVYFEEDNSVEIYTGLLPAAVGDTVNEKTVTAVDASIESLNSLAPYASRVASVTVVDPFEFPTTSLAYYFSGYSACEEFDLALMDTTGVTSYAYMFNGCASVEELNLATFSTEAATSLEGMFYQCSSLTQVDAGTFDTSGVTSFANTFAGCASMEELDLTAWDVSGAYSLAGMMAGMTSLESVNVATWDTSGVATFASMFEGDTSLELLDLANVSTEGATNLTAMFKNCTSLTDLDLASFKTTEVTNMTGMFAGDSALATIYASEDLWSNEKAVRSTGVFTQCEVLVGGNGTEYEASQVSASRALIDRAGQEGYLTDATLECSTFAVFSETDNSLTIYSARVLPKVGAKYQGKVVTAIDSSIEELDALEEYKELVTSVTVADAIVFPAASLEGYFAGYSAAASFELLGLDVSGVTNFTSMFEGCERVRTLNLKGFVLADAVSIDRMFYGCSVLKTIFVMEERWQWGHIEESEDVFTGCVSLVGGAGTKFDEAHLDSLYARVDGLRIKGYLTEAPIVPFAMYSASDNSLRVYAQQVVPEVGQEYAGRVVTALDTSIESLDALAAYKRVATSVTVEDDIEFPATSLTGWLASWTALETADLTRMHSRDLVSMNRLFYGCTALTQVEFASLDTTAVTTMAEMFYGCTSLTKVTFDGFETPALNNMASMFYNCVALTSLNLTNFETAGVTNMRYAFYNCYNLQALYATTGKWTGKALPAGGEIFYNCVKLVGGVGTKFSWSYRGAERAYIDAPGQKGYLIDPEAETPAYAVYSATDKSVRIYDRSPQPILGEEFNGLEVTAIDRTIDTLDDLLAYRYTATSITCEDETNFPVASMYMWLYAWTNLKTADFSLLDTAGVTSMSYVFYCCYALEEIDVSGFDTSSVTDMSCMFNNCRALKSLDLSNFDTRRVTTMYCMMYECYALETADLTSFELTSLTNMSHLFYASTSLTTVYGTSGKWDVSKVRDASNAFGACYKIVGGNGTTYRYGGITFAKIDTVGQAGYLTDAKLESAGFAVYSDDDSEVIIYGPGNCPRPGTVYDGRTVTAVDGSLDSLDGLAAYKTKATAIRMKGEVNFPGTSMYQYLYAWSALKTVDFSLMNTAGVTNMAMLFHSCLALTSVDVSGFNTSSVTDMQSMFQYCRQLTMADLSTFDTSSLTNMYCMFYECYALEVVDLTGWLTPALTNMSHTFYACTKVNTIYATDGKWDASKLNNTINTFGACYKIVGGNGTPYGVVAGTYALVDKENQPGYFTDKTLVGAGFAVYSDDDTEVVIYGPGITPRPGDTYDGRYVTAVDGSLESLDGLAAYKTKATAIRMKGKVDFPGTSMYQYLYAWSALKTVDFSLMNTAGVTNMAMLFHSCLALTSVDVSGFNTSSVTDMQSMFQYCRVLTKVDLSMFKTPKLTNMFCMFYECYALEEVSLAGWSTPALTNMSHTFYACSKLRTIYATDGKWDNSKISDGNNAFAGCGKLTGGNGTPYSEVGSAYAVIDKDGQSGYLTDNSHVSSGFGVFSTDDNEIILYSGDVTPRPGTYYDGRYVTAVDGSLESLDGLAAYRTVATAIKMKGKVDFPGTSMYQYLYGWSALRTVDFSLMNTAGVTNMAMLFHSCTALTSVDVSGFDTSSVTDMQSMFQYCRVLTKVDLSNFKTPKLANMFCMFYECYALEEVNLKGWNTPALTNMSHTFYACSKLRTIYATDGLWDSSKISTGSNAFGGCTNIIGGNGTYYSAVDSSYAKIDKDGQVGYLTEDTYISSGFGVYSDDDKKVIFYAGDVTPRQGEQYDGRTVTAVDGSLESLNGLEKYKTVATAIEMKAVIVFPGTSMASYLSGWTALRTVDFSRLDTKNVTSMYMAFYACSKLETVDLSGFDTGNVTTMACMFQYCTNLKSLDMSMFDVRKVTTTYCMIYECRYLETVDISGWETASLTNMSHMFYGSSVLTTIYATDTFSVSKLSDGSRAFGACPKLTGGAGTICSDESSSYAYVDSDERKGYFTDRYLVTAGFGVYSVDDNELIFYSGDVTPRPGTTYKGRTVTAVDGSIADLNGLANYKSAITRVSMKNKINFPGTTMYQYFYGWPKLASVELSRMDTSNVTSMNMLFAACTTLETVDISGFKTHNVTDMASMFQTCVVLKAIDMSYFDLSKVTTMYCMIYECYKLETVDFTGCTTPSLTNVSHLFYNSLVLTTIYATDGAWDMSKVSVDTNMFAGCSKLVGGNGTTYSVAGRTYARVDKDGQAGYFTDRALQASTAALLLEESSEEASSSMAKGRADAPFVEGESALAQDSQVTPSENLAKEDVASSGEAAAVKKDLEAGAVSAEKTGEAGESTASAAASTGELAADATVPAKEELAEVASEPTQLADEPVVAAAGDYQDQAIAAGEVVASESSEGGLNTALLGRSLEAGEGGMSGAAPLSFEEVAAAVAVVPAGMLLASLRRRAA